MTGVISAEKLASMKPEEMASKQLQELRKQYTKEAINDHQMAQNEGTKTDMFTCGKERFFLCEIPFSMTVQSILKARKHANMVGILICTTHL